MLCSMLWRWKWTAVIVLRALQLTGNVWFAVYQTRVTCCEWSRNYNIDTQTQYTVGHQPINELFVLFFSCFIGLWILDFGLWAGLTDYLFLGTELKLAETCRIDMRELCQDISQDLLQYINYDVDVDVRNLHMPEARAHAALMNQQDQHDPGYWAACDQHEHDRFPLEADSVEALVPAESASDVAVPARDVAVPASDVAVPAVPAAVDLGADMDSDRAQMLFPNSFRIAGLKHISDNLLGSVLQALPQLLVFLIT